MLYNAYRWLYIKLELSCTNTSPTSIKPVNREVITDIGGWPIQRSGQVILEGSRTEDTRPD